MRVAGPGQPQGKALSGEEEIVQSLLEGINTVAYPKSFVKRKAPKVSRAAAEAAISAAGQLDVGRGTHPFALALVFPSLSPPGPSVAAGSKLTVVPPPPPLSSE